VNRNQITSLTGTPSNRNRRVGYLTQIEKQIFLLSETPVCCGSITREEAQKQGVTAREIGKMIDWPPGWLALQELARNARTSDELNRIIDEMNELLREYELRDKPKGKRTRAEDVERRNRD
jgi:hypothetical protein